MSRFLVCVTATVLLVFSVSAEAQGQEKKGWEIYGGIGPSVIRDEDGTETFRGTSFGFIFGGGYRFSENFALGFHGISLGTAEDTIAAVDTEIEVDAFGLSARLIFPMTEKVEAYGILGGIVYDADVRPGGGSFSIFGEDAWELGAGLDFATSENLSLRVEGRYFNGQADESGALLSFGFGYRF
jgi:opacity protein-like surface antigen